MADENKIVTPSDIEEAKTETVDTQTTATVENTVAEKDEKVESVVTDEEIASVEITQPQKAQSSSLRAQMKSLRDEEEEEAKEKEVPINIIGDYEYLEKSIEFCQKQGMEVLL